MAAKKTAPVKGKTSRKSKSRGKSPSKFACPNPDHPFSLEAIVRRMRKHPAFARFIGDLLCASYSEDKGKAKIAHDCLASYYDPTEDELTDLCIPTKYQAAYAHCTVITHNLLIAVPAKLFGRQRAKRSRR